MGLNPTVSVVIPTYDRSNVLDRAIQSVLNQTFQDFEIIIVDDASEDDTENIVKSLNDTRISYHRHRINKGSSASRNTGIKHARGEYVAFLDSDDEWKKTKLQKQLNAFKTTDLSNVGLIFCGIEYIEPDGNSTTRIPKIRGDIYQKLLYNPTKYWNPGTPTFIVKREIARKILFDEDLPTFDDGDFLLRVSKSWNIDSVPIALTIVHQGHTHLHQGVNKVKARKLLLEKYKDEISKRPESLATYYRLIAGDYFFETNEFEYVKKYLQKAYQNNDSLLNLIWVLISHLGSLPLRASNSVVWRLTHPLVKLNLLDKHISPFL